MRVITKTLALCFLACFLTGIPFYALVTRVEAYTNQLAEVVNLVNTTFGIDDWTVTPPYKSSSGVYDLGTYDYQGEDVSLWGYLAENMYIDETTHYGNNHYGFESYKVVALYPTIYYVGSNGVGYEECIRVTLEGTYRSGILGVFGAQVGRLDVYLRFKGDTFYVPNINGDALAEVPVTIGWSALEEIAEYPYQADEAITETLISFLKGTFD